MEFVPQSIPEVVLVRPKKFSDARGFFFESWSEREFVGAGIDARFVQDNHSRSAQGVLRGLHYQLQHAQGKLVRVTRGAVFDVAVDLRRSAPTFGRWVGVVLDEQEHESLWIPPGFAHGFYVLSEHAEFQYKCTDVYAPRHERTLRWDDPELAIAWPLLDGRAPTLSAKDAAGLGIAAAECYP
jgi:dTDP-4-dehydrorhamnose 3,5-epimerase